MTFDNETDVDERELGNIEPSSLDNTPDEPEDDGLAAQEEAVARKRGWVPKEEYRGRPEDWQDATSFLDRNSSLQKDVRELSERLLSKDEEYEARIARMEAANERIIQGEREKLARELEAAKRQAAELGDLDEYDRVRNEEAAHYKRMVEDERRQEAERRPARKPDLLPETQEWIRRNSWFNENQHMQNIALNFYNEALEGLPANKDESKRLAYVEKKMAHVYPDKFGQGQHSAVEGGRRSSAVKPAIHTLSAAERNACNKYIKMGLIKNEAEYVKLLNDE